MNFKNALEEQCYEIAKEVLGADIQISHNKVITIETAIFKEVASFTGPPKKEVDVITAHIRQDPPLDLLISCKDFGGSKAEPAHVQEWCSVVMTMNKYSDKTAFLGIVVSPSGFTKGCEPWATSHNLALIPPLKGVNVKFSPDSVLAMYRRVLLALSKRLAFPYEGILAAPEFHDFAFRLTSDFEGSEASGSEVSRYILTVSGWKSSFGELVSSLIGKKIAELLSTPHYTGIQFDDGFIFRFHSNSVVFGKDDGAVVQLIEPQCRLGVNSVVATYAEIKELAEGKTIRSAADFGDYFEFGISGDVNLGFFPNGFHAISTKNIE